MVILTKCCQMATSGRKGLSSGLNHVLIVRLHLVVEPLHPLTPVPTFHRWSLDFIGQLPETSNGNRWILIAIDHTTKWPIAKVAQRATHEIVARFIYKEIVLNFGCPTEIITDRGNNFTTTTLNAYLKS